MSSEHKPITHRRIGPAMQWAKPRAASGEVDGRTTPEINKIEVKLPAESDYPERNTKQPGQYAAATQFEHESHGSYADWGSRSEISADDYGAFGDTQGFNGSNQNQDHLEQSAWNYYSDNTFQNHDSVQNPWNSSNQAVQGQQHYPDDQAYHQPYQDRSFDHHKTAPFDVSRTRGSKDKGASEKRQFIAPFLVAAVMVLLAFMTLVE